MPESWGTYSGREDRFAEARNRRVIRQLDSLRGKADRTNKLLETQIELQQITNLIAIAGNELFDMSVRNAAVALVTKRMTIL